MTHRVKSIAATSERKSLVLLFSGDASEAKTQIISFNLCSGRRIQYQVPVYICGRWCLIATTAILGMPFHVLLDYSFLLRLSMSLVAHLEKFSGVFFHCKSKTWKYIDTNLPPCAASWVLHDAGKDTVWPLLLLAFFHTPAQGIISPLSVHFFLHLLICGFSLSHSCSAGAFNSQTCSQIFSNISCVAKKGFSECD